LLEHGEHLEFRLSTSQKVVGSPLFSRFECTRTGEHSKRAGIEFSARHGTMKRKNFF
jgi:hypothetical protein